MKLDVTVDIQNLFPSIFRDLYDDAMASENSVSERPTRERIINAALGLLEQGGVAAASNRAISAAAEVQAPAIYREFGDKEGLLHAVVEQGFADYLSDKAVLDETDDPVADLRRGWDLHIDFALAHPALYRLMSTQVDAVRVSPAAEAGWNILASLIHRIARVGRLQVGEIEATRLIHAGGSGTALMLIALPEDQRDPLLSIRARESIISGIVQDLDTPNSPGTRTAAITLRSNIDDLEQLTTSERHLLSDWLNRIIDAASET